ncbi:hypothetical protein [Flavobacterium sp.]
MSKKTKSLIYNFLSFVAFFLPFLIVVQSFTSLSGFWIPVTAAVIATLLAPKFQSVKTPQGEKLFMKWIFMSDAKEIE